MQNNYRARLFKAYVVNAPWTFSAVWTVVKGMIEETTSMKVSITSGAKEEKMKTHINAEQLEQKYGGDAPNVEHFWPPTNAGGEFFVDGDIPSQILS